EILPELKLQSLAGAEIEKVGVNLDDAAVEQAIENLRQRHLNWHRTEHPAEKGNRVVVSFEGFKGGQPVKKSRMTETPLVLGEGIMPLQFEEALYGCREEEEKE